MAIFRRPLALASVALLVPALGSAALHNGAPSGSSRPAAAAAGGDSEFIVRCPATGEVRHVDPIFDPGATAGHYHLFFGNEGAQVNPGDGGAGVDATSTYDSMESGNTTCQDGQGTSSGDTAGYWVPLPMFEPTNSYSPYGYDSSSSLCATGANGHTACPLLPGCTELSSPQGDFSYKCTEDTNNGIYIRAYYTTTAAAQVSEFPKSTTMLSGNPKATGPEPAGNSFPVFFDCGANDKVQTPYSSWPYNCLTTYTNANGTFSSQGVVMVIEFPRCWMGTKTWPEPNNTNGVKVPGFSTNSKLLPAGANEDLEYPDGGPGPGGCPSVNDTLIPHLTERIHFINLYNVSQSGTGTINPSSCTQGGANLPSSECTTQPAYNSHGTIGLEFSSDPSGAPGMFWTAHADYWQTWQQGDGVDETANPGTLDDLTEDCLVEQDRCGFVGSPPSGGDYPNDNPSGSAASDAVTSRSTSHS